METQTAGSAVAFFTNNGTDTVTIPAGNWVASLALRSEAVATSIQDQDEDMIFHMEDGVGVAPDNSQASSSRDLAGCDSIASGSFQEYIQISSNDAEQRASGTTYTGEAEDKDFLVLGKDGDYHWVGLRWSLDVPSGVTITAADISFMSDAADSGSLVLSIGAEDTDNAAAFSSSSYNISNRWDGTTNTVTTAQVTWSSIGSWSKDERGSDTTTPDLSAIVQEIVDRGSWSSGNNIVFMLKDGSGGTINDNRKARYYDRYDQVETPQLTVTWAGVVGNPPTWQAGTGPHSSGSHK